MKNIFEMGAVFSKETLARTFEAIKNQPLVARPSRKYSDIFTPNELKQFMKLNRVHRGEMTQMEKALNLVRVIKKVRDNRWTRFETHLESGNCKSCHHFRDYEGPKVDTCAEAERLKERARKAESRARVVTLLILENVHARG